jgi:hypothetical protein
MAKKIYFPALQSDITLIFKKISGWLFNGWIWGIVGLTSILIDFSSWVMILTILGSFSLINHLVQYFYLKKLEKKGEVLFFEKKSNERNRNIIYLVIAIVLMLIMTNMGADFLIFGFFMAYFLLKYIFYMPSTVFIANDYELVVKRKRKRKVFDFSYPNRLRFVYNMISFDHPIDGKETWKDINMDRDKMNEIRLFLSKNFGNEMVLNPTTGLPYTI